MIHFFLSNKELPKKLANPKIFSFLVKTQLVVYPSTP